MHRKINKFTNELKDQIINDSSWEHSHKEIEVRIQKRSNNSRIATRSKPGAYFPRLLKDIRHTENPKKP